MKNDDNQTTRGPGGGEMLEPWVEPAMEVRLVALALGEASEFERAELEEAMAAEPELRAFFDRICGADSLFAEVLAAGASEENEKWRMAGTRREVVLNRIRGNGGANPGREEKGSPVVGGAGAPVGRERSWTGHLGSIAATLVALLAIGGLFLPMGEGIKTGMMPSSGAVSDRDYKREYRLGYLFDSDGAEAKAMPQLARPTEMPASRQAETPGSVKISLGKADSWEWDHPGAIAASGEAKGKESSSPAKIRRLARADQSSDQEPGADATAASDDYGLVVDSKTTPMAESENAYWYAPRLASVPAPTQAEALSGTDERFRSDDLALSKDTGEKGDVTELGTTVFEHGMDGLERDETRFGSVVRSGRLAEQPELGRIAEEVVDESIAGASVWYGGIGGAGISAGGGAAGEERAESKTGEVLQDAGEEVAVVDLTKRRSVAKPQAAAAESSPGRATVSESEVFTVADGEGESLDTFAAIVPEPSQSSLADGIVVANESSAEITGLAAVADNQLKLGQTVFGDQEEEESRSDALSSRLHREDLSEEKLRSKFKSGRESEGVIEDLVAELDVESEPAVLESAQSMSGPLVQEKGAGVVGSTGGVRSRALITNIEQGGAQPGAILGPVGVIEEGRASGELEGGEMRKNGKWFEGDQRGKRTNWGRPSVATETSAAEQIGRVTRGVVEVDRFFEGSALGTADKARASTATSARGEAAPNRVEGAVLESGKAGELLNFSGNVDGGGAVGKKAEELAKSVNGIAERPEPAVRAVELARTDPASVSAKGLADFDVDFGRVEWGLKQEAEFVETRAAKQTATLSLSIAAADPEVAEVRKEPAADGFRRWEKATTELETATVEEAFSTFSMHVSDVSFKLAAVALLEGGSWPEVDKIRVEEFVNAFDYGDPGVSLEEKIACRTEQAAHPFLQQRNLVRVSMRAAASGRSGGQPLRLTVLLDKSGSMEREDREAAVAKAMDALASHLTSDDVITVIGFARTPRLIADRMSGDRAGELAKLVAQAPSEGGTNLEEALELGREIALRQQLDGGMNRIVLMTDGAANLGNASPEALSEMVVRLRNEGVAFDACGVGADGLNDKILEALTREGDGRYYFLNRAEDADEGFVKQLAGALRPAAKNVKVQVEFNPQRVRGYRLLGFDKHRLEKEDFRNDTVDAAEMAAEEAGVAVYQTEVIPDGVGDVGKVWVRFQDTATGEMVERSWRIPYEARAPRLAEAPPAMKLAGTAVLLGERLRGQAAGELVDLAELAAIGAPLRQEFSGNQRVGKLIQMIEAARNLEQ